MISDFIYASVGYFLFFYMYMYYFLLLKFEYENKISGFTHELQKNPLKLTVNTVAYVKIYTPDADSSTKMIVQSCYATPTSDEKVGPTFPLIENRYLLLTIYWYKMRKCMCFPPLSS
jgi:hypothetical protein